MSISYRILWLLLTIINIASVIWYILASTAAFQRSLDLVATVRIVYFGVPSLILSISSLVLILKRWAPASNFNKMGLNIVLFLLLVLSAYLFMNVSTKGWLTDIIRSDSVKTTSDNKYEYRLDLVNLFQRNSHAKLYTKNKSSGVEKYIELNINTQEIIVITSDNVNNWVELEPTGKEDIYYLNTAKSLMIPIESFEIDINNGSVKKLE